MSDLSDEEIIDNLVDQLFIDLPTNNVLISVPEIKTIFCKKLKDINNVNNTTLLKETIQRLASRLVYVNNTNSELHVFVSHLQDEIRILKNKLRVLENNHTHHSCISLDKKYSIAKQNESSCNLI